MLLATACGDDGGATSEDGSSGVVVSSSDTPTTGNSATADPTTTTDPSMGSSDESTGDDSSDTDTDTGTVPASTPLDILLVVDDTQEMSSVEYWIDNDIEALANDLYERNVDFRFAVIDTSLPNPWCPATQAEDAGAFETRSCEERLDEFTAPSGQSFEHTCSSQCNYPSIDLGAHPWITRDNIPDDVDSEAFGLGQVMNCIAKQGFAGCGFEQPLEAMYLALQRSRDPNAAEFGFVRPEANLLIVLDTSEADCSFADESIFDAEGPRTFWSNPDDPSPSSALCWNAGVNCEGDPSSLDCSPANKNAMGEPAGGEDAVLHPLERYTSLIETIRAEKSEFGTDVFVHGALGVAESGDTIYRLDGSDPQFEDAHGIGPGCVFSQREGGAVPPVRMREFIRIASPQTDELLAFSSICSFSHLIDFWATKILDQP